MRVAVDHRDAILQTAARLFARKKFHEVLMDDVAEQVGIAKGTIYRYFPNKEELFAALSFSHMDMLGVAVGLIAVEKTPPLERLGRMLLRLAELIHENDDFFQVMMRHECELWAQRQSEFSAKRGVIRDHIVTVLKQAQGRKEISCPFELNTAADMLLGAMRSLMRFTTPQPSPEKTAQLAMQLFLYGVRTPKAGGAE